MWGKFYENMIRLITLLFVFVFTMPVLSNELQTVMQGQANSAEIKSVFQQFVRDHKRAGMQRKQLFLVYDKYLDSIGVKRIADYLEKDDPSCHGVAHTLGKAIFQRLEKLDSSMAACSSTCTYACLHGVFKVYFDKLGKSYHEHDMKKSAHKKTIVFTQSELEAFSREINTVCDKSNSMVEGFYSGNCAHGVGHAMATLAGKPALATIYCAIFPSIEMKYYCETGVFMEMASKIKNQIYTSNLRRSEKVAAAVKYCTKQSHFPSACLRFIAPSNKSLGQITRFAKQCMVMNGKARLHCFNALGYHSRSYIAKNLNEIAYTCIIGDESDKKACISGVSLMKKGHRFQKKIQQGCSLLNGPDEKMVCKDQIGQYYYQLDNQYFKNIL